MIALVKNNLEKSVKDFAGQIEIAGASALSNRAIEAAIRPTAVEAADGLLHSFLKTKSSNPYADVMSAMDAYKAPFAMQAYNGFRMMCTVIGDPARFGIVMPVARLIETQRSSHDRDPYGAKDDLETRAAPFAVAEQLSSDLNERVEAHQKLATAHKRSQGKTAGPVKNDYLIRVCTEKDGQSYLARQIVSSVGHSKDMVLPVQRAIPFGDLVVWTQCGLIVAAMMYAVVANRDLSKLAPKIPTTIV